MKKLKIAYILTYLGVSGGVGVVFQHANRLLKRGHTVIIGAQTPIVPTDWFPGQSVPVLKVQDLPSDLDILVATSWETVYDVIRLKARHKCYFVQSDETRFHQTKSDFFHVTQLSYLLNVSFLTEAKWIKLWLAENFGKDAVLIPNGLDEKIFFQDTPLKKKNGRKRVLLEGAIDLPYKGMKDAFEAVQGLDAEIWCVSALGRPKPDWKCDQFFEMVPISEMRRIYSSCDILLKMSTVEGVFGPPLEMMACGGVSVVSKVTGYDEYIIDGENALVVNPSDVKGARDAIEKLIDNNVLYGRLKSNGLKTAKASSWELSIDKLERLFLDIEKGKWGYFSSVQEQTNNSLGHFFGKVTPTNLYPAQPYEVILKKLGQRKAIQYVFTKIYYPLRKIRNFIRQMTYYKSKWLSDFKNKIQRLRT